MPDDPFTAPEPEGKPADARIRTNALVGLVLVGMLCGGVFGGLLNWMNGEICPKYFALVMNWQVKEEFLKQLAIAQGVFEGLIFGTIYSLVFAVSVGMITRVRATFGFSIKYLLAIFPLALVGAAFGGLMALLFAQTSPDSFRTMFGTARDLAGEQLARFAWVAGSIWGVQAGALITLFLMLVSLRAYWLEPSRDQ